MTAAPHETPRKRTRKSSLGNGGAKAAPDEPMPTYRADLDAITGSEALAELIALPERWVNWRYELRGKGWTKPPYRPNGARADVSKPITWFDYAQCAAALKGTTAFTGVGFVLDGSDDLVGIDFDDCIGPSSTGDPTFARFITGLDSYCEVSPSGTGLRCFLRGRLSRDSITFTVGGVTGTAFRARRYLTITGERALFLGAPDRIEHNQGVLDWIEEEHARGRTSQRTNGATYTNGSGRKTKAEHDGSGAPPWFDLLPEHRQPEELPRLLAVLVHPRFGEDYELWLKMSCAVYDACDGQDWGFEAWDAWCQLLPNYDADENAYKWPTFATERPDKATVGSLIELAKQNGYELPPNAHDALEEAHRASIKMFQDYAAPEAPKEEAQRPNGQETPQAQAPKTPFIGPIGEIVEALAWQTEADPWGIYAGLLVMYGNWLGRRVYVQVGADRHFATLYALLVGLSATGRKGTAVGLVTMIMNELDPDWVAHNVFRHVNSGQGVIQTVKNVNLAFQERTNSNLDRDMRAMFVLAEFADLLAKTKMESSTVLATLRALWDDGSADNTSVTRPAKSRRVRLDPGHGHRARAVHEPIHRGTRHRHPEPVPHPRRRTVPGAPGHPPIANRRASEAPSGRAATTSAAWSPGLFRSWTPTMIPLSAEADQDAIALRLRFEAPAKNWVTQPVSAPTSRPCGSPSCSP